MRRSIPFHVVLTGVLLAVPIAARSAERLDSDLYENLDHLKVARQSSPAEMRKGIEAALKIPDWKPTDRSKGANNWTPVGGTITSPDPAFERDAIGRIRCAAWAWHNGLAEETLWAGASSGGLYFLGRNPIVPIIRMWVPVSKNLPGSHSVGAFLVRPGNSDIILIGTGDPGRWEGGTGLYRTTDGGTTWTELLTPYAGSFFGVLPLEDDVVLLFGLRGHLFRSEDAGESWLEIETGTVAMLTSGITLADGTIVITGLGGIVLVSSDGGRTFEIIEQSSRRGIQTVVQASDDSLLLVGEFGVRLLPVSELGGGMGE